MLAKIMVCIFNAKIATVQCGAAPRNPGLRCIMFEDFPVKEL